MIRKTLNGNASVLDPTACEIIARMFMPKMVNIFIILLVVVFKWVLLLVVVGLLMNLLKLDKINVTLIMIFVKILKMLNG
jgi:hypothetical protein